MFLPAFLLFGCGYQLSVVQGLPSRQSDVKSVAVGSSRVDVHQILGSPNFFDPFHAGCEGYFYKHSATHQQLVLWVCFDDSDRVVSSTSSPSPSSS